MTLPKGFGMDYNSRCPKCRTFLGQDEYGNTVCLNTYCKIGRGKKDDSINVPISRWGIKRTIFYVLFYGGILSWIAAFTIPSSLTIILGFLGIFSVVLPAIIALVEYAGYGDNDWNKRKQLFFIFVPIANLINRISLKDDDR